MKEQETIRELKLAKNRLMQFNHMDNNRINAFNMAFESIEKQIPKKIVRVKLRPTEWGSEYRCPVCESELIPIEFFNDDGTEPYEKISWCSDCGQKLDWGD